MIMKLATRAVCLLLAVTGAKSTYAAGDGSRVDQPNIIVVMLDDVPDDISFMPRTSAALKSGTRYSNSFANFPLCAPSRATFLTGQEAHNHGILGDSGHGLKPAKLVSHALQKAGYKTGIFGKRPKPVKGNMEQLGLISGPFSKMEMRVILTRCLI